MHPNLPTWIIASLALIVSTISLVVALKASSHTRRAKNIDLKAELARRADRLKESVDGIVAKARHLKQVARDTSNIALFESVSMVDDAEMIENAEKAIDRLLAVPPSAALATLEKVGRDIDQILRKVNAMDRKLDESAALHAPTTEKGVA